MSALAATAVKVALGGRPILGPVTARFELGTCVGLAGPNGAGKSTLLRALAGLIVPETGGVTLGERSLGALDRREIARSVAYVAQSARFDLPFTVREVVAMGRYAHGDATTKAGRAATSDALSRLELDSLADRAVTALSGGERQRVVLARAMATGAPIWLLDEPTTALDLRHAFDLISLVQNHVRSGGLVILAHHDLNLLLRATNRVLVLRAGALHADDLPARALTPAIVRDVFEVDVDLVDTSRGTVLWFGGSAPPRSRDL